MKNHRPFGEFIYSKNRFLRAFSALRFGGEPSEPLSAPSVLSTQAEIHRECAMEDLRGTATPEIETSNTPKIMGAVLVVLAIGALGGYTLSSGLWNSPAPREMASREPVPVKITGPVAPVAPAPVGAPISSPYQHASET